MGRYVEEALDAGAVGVSSGLIYAPGRPRRARRGRRAGRRRGTPRARCTRRTCATSRRACSTRSTRRSRRPGPRATSPDGRPASRSRTSRRARTPSGAWRTRWSSGSMRPGAPASTPPPTSTRTRRPRRPCRRSCRPRSSPCPIDEAVAAIRDTATRATIRDLMQHGVSGWENVSLDPGWAGIVISRSGSRPEWDGRSLAGHRRRARRRPGGPRARRPRRRPAVHRHRHPLHGRARRRDDHARALDRRLHRRRGPSAGPPDPGPGRAAPANLRARPPACSATTCAIAASSTSRRPSRS